jgi:hypothetical protein
MGLAEKQVMPLVVGLVVFVIANIVLGGFGGSSVCKDGWASPSIGKRGACSHHGGVGGQKNGGWIFLLSVGLGFSAGVIARQVQNPPSNLTVRKGNLTIPTKSEVVTTELKGKTVHCPRCGSRMVKRTAKRGVNTGNSFFGCSKYPKCTGTRSI